MTSIKTLILILNLILSIIRCERNFYYCSECKREATKIFTMNDEICPSFKYLCDKQCFGENCEKKCPVNCVECERKEGKCLECKPGYWGENCENRSDFSCKISEKNTGKCIECAFKWGDNCEKSCPKMCNFCEKKTGLCTDCSVGLFDADCSEYCPKDCNKCTIDGKKCLNCKDSKKYGDECNLYCPFNCDDTQQFEICNKEGNCKSCKKGFYGRKCEIPCSEGCEECSNDFPICENCKIGYWGGMSCNLKCSEKCGKNGCNKYTGFCNECLEGFYGKDCEKVCENSSKTKEHCENNEKFPYLKLIAEFENNLYFTKICLGNSCFKVLIDFYNPSSFIQIPNNISLSPKQINGHKIDDFIKYFLSDYIPSENFVNFSDWKSSVTTIFGTFDGNLANDTLTIGEVKIPQVTFSLFDSFKFISIYNFEFEFKDTYVIPIENKGISGVLSFAPSKVYMTFNEMLYQKNIINRNILHIKNTLENKQEISIGDIPEYIKQNYDKVSYINLGYFKFVGGWQVQSSGLKLKGGYNFTQYITTNIEIMATKQNQLEKYDFILTSKFFDFFQNNYFIGNFKNICKGKDIMIKEVTFKTFECDSNAKINELPKIGLILNDYIYYFDSDLFFNKENNIYSMRILIGGSSSFIHLRKEYLEKLEIIVDFEKKNLMFYGGDRVRLEDDISINDSLSGGVIALITISTVVALAGIVFVGTKLYKIYMIKKLDANLNEILIE